MSNPSPHLKNSSNRNAGLIIAIVKRGELLSKLSEQFLTDILLLLLLLFLDLRAKLT